MLELVKFSEHEIFSKVHDIKTLLHVKLHIIISKSENCD